MKILIHGEAVKEEKKLYLKLVQAGCNVELRVVDNYGEDVTRICAINNDGKMRIYTHVAECTGLALDGDGRIVVIYS